MAHSADQGPFRPDVTPANDAGLISPTEPGAPPDSTGGRIGGLDVARALAIIGMAMVHFGPSSPPPDDWTSWFYGQSHGRAALLFVVLAGIGMTLLAGDRDRRRWHRAWPRLVTRIIVLLPLGLSLQLMDIRPLVILHYYAVFFLLGAPATLLRDRVLLILTALVSVAGPVAYLLIDRAQPQWLVRYNPIALDDPPALIIRELLFTGSYPAMVWMAPFLFGMWLGRRRLNALSTRLGLLAGGAAAMLLTGWLAGTVPEGEWWKLANTKPHSQMIAWLIGSTGAATALLATCLIVTDLLGRLMWPLIAMGQLALTLYVGHLFLLAAAPETFSASEVEPALVIVSGFAAGGALFSVVWLVRFKRGPLETLLDLPARLIGKGRSSGY